MLPVFPAIGHILPKLLVKYGKLQNLFLNFFIHIATRVKVVHTARVSQHCLRTLTTLPWLPDPQNLSPIEHIWDHLGRLFERGRIIGLKEAGWTNRRIACHISRSNAAIRRRRQEWADHGRIQRPDGRGRPRSTADREDILIVRSTVTAPDSSLSTIRCAIRTRVSTMTIHRRLIENNLRSY
ncbi:HTH_Tnp_Tc3_2 domain-containing protein [Trichonephila clavipes]|nr:HTH_Tnp_Tc3_2 domain-containing protein [Trichonephila clavipes]